MIGWRAAENGGAELSVTDTGCGMTADDLKRVFQPFNRASAALARKRHDTGLGLPLCKRFAEMHGGDLAIESTPGKGTRIALAIPASRVIEASRITAAAA